MLGLFHGSISWAGQDLFQAEGPEPLLPLRPLGLQKNNCSGASPSIAQDFKENTNKSHAKVVAH